MMILTISGTICRDTWHSYARSHGKESRSMLLARPLVGFVMAIESWPVKTKTRSGVTSSGHSLTKRSSMIYCEHPHCQMCFTPRAMTKCSRIPISICGTFWCRMVVFRVSWTGLTLDGFPIIGSIRKRIMLPSSTRSGWQSLIAPLRALMSLSLTWQLNVAYGSIAFKMAVRTLANNTVTRHIDAEEVDISNAVHSDAVINN